MGAFPRGRSSSTVPDPPFSPLREERAGRGRRRGGLLPARLLLLPVELRSSPYPIVIRSMSNVAGAGSSGPVSQVGHQVFAITNMALLGMPRRNSCITTPSTRNRTVLADHSIA